MTAPSVVPGRGTPTLDEQIAEQLFGYQWWSWRVAYTEEPVKALVAPTASEPSQWGYERCESDAPIRRANRHRVPAYSSDIAAAWEVVEKVRGFGFTVNVEGLVPWNSPNWFVGFSRFSLRTRVNSDYHAMELTLPLAICRAALLAMAGSVVPSSVVLAVDPSWSTPDSPAVACAPSIEEGAARRHQEGRTT